MTGSELEREQIIKDAITKAYDTGDMTQKEFEDAFYSSRNYSLDDQGNIISTPKIRPTANIGGGGGENLLDPCKGPNPPAYCFVGIRSVEPEVEEEVDMDDRALAFRADGGRIGFRIGSGEGKDVSQSRSKGGLGGFVYCSTLLRSLSLEPLPLPGGPPYSLPETSLPHQILF